MSRILEEKLPGVFLIEGTGFADHRGELFKPLYDSVIPGFRADEVYYIISKKDVIRGMHFQTSPFEQGKFIYVSKGRVLDVVLDIRKYSSSFGNYVSYELDEKMNRGIYVPPGFAHGYLTLEEDSHIHYVQSGNYSKEHEYGVRYNSFGFQWPLEKPILSEKDSFLPSFRGFQSPF